MNFNSQLFTKQIQRLLAHLNTKMDKGARNPYLLVRRSGIAFDFLTARGINLRQPSAANLSTIFDLTYAQCRDTFKCSSESYQAERNLDESKVLEDPVTMGSTITGIQCEDELLNIVKQGSTKKMELIKNGTV